MAVGKSKEKQQTRAATKVELLATYRYFPAVLWQILFIKFKSLYGKFCLLNFESLYDVIILATCTVNSKLLEVDKTEL